MVAWGERLDRVEVVGLGGGEGGRHRQLVELGEQLAGECAQLVARRLGVAPTDGGSRRPPAACQPRRHLVDVAPVETLGGEGVRDEVLRAAPT